MAYLKDQKENKICTMDDIRGDFLGPPRGTAPATVRANKNKTKILFIYSKNKQTKIHCTNQTVL